MRNVVAKVLFVIDGVAERKTSNMLNAVLASRLDFPCFVHVVANYVLAFESAANQEFDAIVLPRTSPDTHYSTDEFLQDLTHVVGFNASIIHTVDHDSAAHVYGKTVRSSKEGSDGYVVDDLVAAISSTVQAGSLAEKQGDCAFVVSNEAPQEQQNRPSACHQEHNKRSRDDCAEPMSVSEQQQHKQQRSNKHPRYEGQDRRQYPCSADDIAYQQWLWHQWQVLAHAQAQAQQGCHFPVRAGGVSAQKPTMDCSTAVSILSISGTPTSPLPPHSHHPSLPHYYYHPMYHTQHHTHPLHPFPHPNPYHSAPHLHNPHSGCVAPMPQQLRHPEPVPQHHQRTARADSCSATTTLTSSTLSDATEEEAASVASKDLCAVATACADSLSTVSSDTGDELFDFMNDELWFTEGEY